MGFSDRRLAELAGKQAKDVRALRKSLDVHPAYKRIDTSAAEFASPTAYMYSTYEVPFAGAVADEARPSDRKKVVILGGGPNRIGQGIEFDYCCCHAAFALQRCRLRDHHGQLQPRDRLDRLRHLRPPLFRAADRGRRHRDPRARKDERHAASASSCSSAARPRSISPMRSRRPACRSSAPSRELIDLAEDRDLFSKLINRLELTQPQATASPIRSSRPASSPSGSAIRWSSARPTCSAAAPCRSSTPPNEFETYVQDTLTCAGAARHPDPLPQRQDRPDQLGALRQPAAVRRLSQPRHRDRRRLPQRRQGRLRLRHHGAHRGSRHPFGRQRLLAAAAEPLAPRSSPSSSARPPSSRSRSRSAA